MKKEQEDDILMSIDDKPYSSDESENKEMWIVWAQYTKCNSETKYPFCRYKVFATNEEEAHNGVLKYPLEKNLGTVILKSVKYDPEIRYDNEEIFKKFQVSSASSTQKSKKTKKPKTAIDKE